MKPDTKLLCRHLLFTRRLLPRLQPVPVQYVVCKNTAKRPLIILPEFRIRTTFRHSLIEFLI